MAQITNLFDNGKDFTALAIEKLNSESKSYKGNKYGDAVHSYVTNALREFCSQDVRFAEVFYKTKRTLSDCIAHIMKGCGNAISDIEVYRRATKFYFPNSEIEFIMKITTAEAPDEKYMNKEITKPKAEVEKKDKKSAAVKPKKSEEKKKEPEVIQLSLF